MIIDHIDNARRYYGIGAGIEAGLRFLKPADMQKLPLGKIDINCEKLFANVSEYTTSPETSVQWEAHRQYIDVQYLASGAESMEYQCISKLQIETQYDKKNDVLFLRGEGNRFLVPSGFFVIFYPHDAHRPGIIAGRPQKIRKIVVKVMVD